MCACARRIDGYPINFFSEPRRVLIVRSYMTFTIHLCPSPFGLADGFKALITTDFCHIKKMKVRTVLLRIKYKKTVESILGIDYFKIVA